MGKFWPSSKDDCDPAPSLAENGGGSGRNGPHRSQCSANERTALLSPQPQPQPIRLHPDDPAVSAYNLLSVRSLKAISVIFLVVSFLWWLVLLVSTFWSPPGLHTRGGGWFAFAYATLAASQLLALIVFYGTPSKVERGLWYAILFFLFVGFVLVIGAYPIRNDEAWAGIVSVIWALFVTAWCIICDSVVEYGRHEEQERLTGIRNSRRTLREWCSVFSGSTLLSVFLAITVLFTINHSIRAWDGTLSPPGDRYEIDNGKYRVHVNCVGSKTHPSTGKTVTTVFLEAGEEPVEGRLESWAHDAYIDKVIKRYCYWDRPGYAFSDCAPSPLSAGMAMDALSEALVQANENGPWILVSHGVGGIYSRIFASRHASDVKGLLLVDTLHESLLDHIASPRRGLILWLRGVLYPLGIDQMVTTIFMGHGRAYRVYGRDSYMQGSEIKAKLQGNLATTFTANEIAAARAILPRDTPIKVVSSGRKVKRDEAWNNGQRQLYELSTNATWDVVNDAPHEVWRDAKGREILDKRLAQLLIHS